MATPGPGPCATSSEAPALRLARAMRNGQTLAPGTVPRPPDLDAAEAVQDAMLHFLGWKATGWKLGASTWAARRALGFDRPFSAPLPAKRCLAGPAIIPGARLRQRGAECELAISFARSIALSPSVLSRLSEDSLLAEIEAAVGGVHAAIELPESRFATLGAEGPEVLVADNGAAGWIIFGPSGPLSALRDGLEGALLIDGIEVACGDATAFVAQPLVLLADHVRRMSRRGWAVEAGTVVLLGSVTPLVTVAPKSRVVARFDGLAPAVLTVAGPCSAKVRERDKRASPPLGATPVGVCQRQTPIRPTGQRPRALLREE